jgi:hypothetical protein
MINNKKITTLLQTQYFINKFPILLLLQHNNFTVKDWCIYRKKIQEISSNSIQNGVCYKTSCNQLEIFNVKNSVLKKSLLNTDRFPISTKNTLHFLCQGPNFLIGCKNLDHLNAIWNFIHSDPKCIFISCIYHNQLYSHLDLEKLLETNNSIYLQLIEHCNKKTDLYSTLRQNLYLYPLYSPGYNLINILSQYKYFLQSNC